MRVLIFLIISFVCMSCSTLRKPSHYDSVVETSSYSSKKGIVDSLRSVANLNKNDFVFISEQMKIIVESYKVLQSKLFKLEKKMNRLLANASLKESTKINSNVQISTEEISDNALQFDDEKIIPLEDDASTSLKEKIVANTNQVEKEKVVQEDSQKKDQDSLSFIEAKKLYFEKSWESAISKFQDYRSQNPKGIYIIEATYYIGESFRYLKMLPEARVYYKEIVKSYPTSSWALKAKQQLKSN